VAAGIFVVVVMVNAAVMRRVEKIVMMSLSVWRFEFESSVRLSEIESKINVVP
jgi:hypothetical protein